MLPHLDQQTWIMVGLEHLTLRLRSGVPEKWISRTTNPLCYLVKNIEILLCKSPFAKRGDEYLTYLPWSSLNEKKTIGIIYPSELEEKVFKNHNKLEHH